MKFTALVSVAGCALPDPAPGGYNASTSTLVDNARNTEGVVVGTIIREDVAKVALKWNFLTLEQWAYILQLFDSSHGGNFFNEVRFLNQVTGEYTTRTMYVSDRNAGAFVRDQITGDIKGWQSPTLSLVEV